MASVDTVKEFMVENFLFGNEEQIELETDIFEKRYNRFYWRNRISKFYGRNI